jgi:hypothetical protein
MKKIIILITFITSVLSLGGSSIDQKKVIIEMNKDLPFIIKNLSLNVENGIDQISRKVVPAIISIDPDDFSPSVSLSNKIDGISITKLNWKYKGIPVEGRYTVLMEKNGSIFKIHNFIKQFNIDINPSVDKLTAAKSVFSKKFDLQSNSPDFISKLVIIEGAGGYRLAWKLRFRPESILDGRFFYVDAHSGESLGGGNFVMSLSENSAKVFETNPVRDKDPITVELPWIADDSDGKLTAELDELDVRKVVAANCPDLGDKMDYYGQQYPICTPTQLADKNENGNFIYEDWDDGIKFKNDPDDLYSEVSVYYHIAKIYKYILGLGIKDFTHLGNHRVSTEKNPIIGVSNFRMPSSATSLSPMDNAFYSPHDPFFSEMFFSNFDYNGDIIVLGQGSKGDFAYDGDVIYHEFGHAVVEGTAGLEYRSFPDKYGYSNEALALNEGMADTFSFIISEDPCLGEYVSEAFGAMYGMEKHGEFYCLRYADNDNIVNESFIGESHHDGLPAVSAHWKMFKAAKEKGYDMDDFAKFFMQSLMSIPRSDLQFGGWAKVLLSVIEDSNISEMADTFEEILEEKGFFNEVRARNIKNKAQYFMSGGIAQYQGMPSSSIEVEIDGSTMEVAPMYIQFYYDVPECIDTLTITGTARTQDGSGSNPRYNILVRKENPVIWTVDDIPFKVDYDKYIIGSGEWTLSNLEPGKRYYIQFINTGPEGLLYNMKTIESWKSESECSPQETEEEINDEDLEEETDEDVFSDDTVDTDKKDTKSSGCSLTVF